MLDSAYNVVSFIDKINCNADISQSYSQENDTPLPPRINAPVLPSDGQQHLTNTAAQCIHICNSQEDTVSAYSFRGSIPDTTVSKDSGAGILLLATESVSRKFNRHINDSDFISRSSFSYKESVSNSVSSNTIPTRRDNLIISTLAYNNFSILSPDQSRNSVPQPTFLSHTDYYTTQSQLSQKSNSS